MTATRAARLLPLLALLASAGACATSPEEETGALSRAALGCELVEAGYVRIRATYRGDLPQRLRALGLVTLKDSQALVETYRRPDGTSAERFLGWEGIGMRWNDPACTRRR